MIIDLGPEKNQKQIYVEKPEIKSINAIKTELETFHESISDNTEPLVSIMDGYASLELAYQVMEKIEKNIQLLT